MEAFTPPSIPTPQSWHHAASPSMPTHLDLASGMAAASAQPAIQHTGHTCSRDDAPGSPGLVGSSQAISPPLPPTLPISPMRPWLLFSRPSIGMAHARAMHTSAQPLKSVSAATLTARAAPCARRPAARRPSSRPDLGRRAATAGQLPSRLSDRSRVAFSRKAALLRGVRLSFAPRTVNQALVRRERHIPSVAPR
eukprot:222429-Chlamydomonas_euryale.AAC.5